jgi:N-methylhydantoinase A/oxoprolinase/acetone carboxylase beta subunit
MPHAVAVDIGGTFTDLVAYDDAGRAVAYTKSPTTYGNLVEGVLDCFAKAKLEPRAASFVNHGTTLVINALVQRKGAKAALVSELGVQHRTAARGAVERHHLRPVGMLLVGAEVNVGAQLGIVLIEIVVVNGRMGRL